MGKAISATSQTLEQTFSSSSTGTVEICPLAVNMAPAGARSRAIDREDAGSRADDASCKPEHDALENAKKAKKDAEDLLESFKERIEPDGVNKDLHEAALKEAYGALISQDLHQLQRDTKRHQQNLEEEVAERARDVQKAEDALGVCKVEAKAKREKTAREEAEKRMKAAREDAKNKTEEYTRNTNLKKPHPTKPGEYLYPTPDPAGKEVWVSREDIYRFFFKKP
jgi:hypothetical protein